MRADVSLQEREFGGALYGAGEAPYRMGKALAGADTENKRARLSPGSVLL